MAALTLPESAKRPEGCMNGNRQAHEEVAGVYIISVAARILEMHPQTLRKYERIGLVRPSRTMGMLRLYSDADVRRLRLIKHLVGDLGVNLAGVQLALRMFNKLMQMKAQTRALEGKTLKQSMDESVDELIEMIQGPS